MLACCALFMLIVGCVGTGNVSKVATATLPTAGRPDGDVPAWLQIGSTPSDAVPAPTAAYPSPGAACAQGLLPGVRLDGDPNGSPAVWVTSPDGDRHTVLWPFGFYATFDPGLELFAGDGTLVARGGDVLDLGGGDGANGFYACVIKGVYYVWPPAS